MVYIGCSTGVGTQEGNITHRQLVSQYMACRVVYTYAKGHGSIVGYVVYDIDVNI